MNIPEGNPKRVDSLIINDETEEPSLLNSATGQILITNSVGKRIIELADGSRDVETIVETLAGEFEEATKETVSQHARKFLNESTQKGIVQWSTPA